MNEERKKEIGGTRNLNVSIFPCKGMAWILESQSFGKLAHFSGCTFKGYKGGLFYRFAYWFSHILFACVLNGKNEGAESFLGWLGWGCYVLRQFKWTSCDAGEKVICHLLNHWKTDLKWRIAHCILSSVLNKSRWRHWNFCVCVCAF